MAPQRRHILFQVVEHCKNDIDAGDPRIVLIAGWKWRSLHFERSHFDPRERVTTAIRHAYEGRATLVENWILFTPAVEPAGLATSC